MYGDHCMKNEIAYLLVMAIGEYPVFLLGVEKKAEDVEAEAVLLIGGALICADQQTVLHLRVRQQHDLEQSVSLIYSVKSQRTSP